MKKNLPTILLGATFSLAMATFGTNVFAQGAGGGGSGTGAREPVLQELVPQAVAAETWVPQARTFQANRASAQ